MKKYLKQLKANKKGFTLIEMIVVIAIIGILAAILVPSMAGYLSTARDSKKEANAKTVYTAAQAAVTSLEATNPIGSTTYKYTEYEPDGTDDIDELFKKIILLVGESNISQFGEIEVVVADGSVTSVKVLAAGDDATTQAITYPKSEEE